MKSFDVVTHSDLLYTEDWVNYHQEKIYKIVPGLN